MDQEFPLTEDLAGAQCDFEDMHLHVGDKVQIEMLEAHDNARHLTTLIGYLKGVSLLVKTPIVNGLSLPMGVGDAIVVRVFSGMKAYAFNAKVERVCLSPFAYVHLSFPANIRSMEVRKAMRLRVDMPATAMKVKDRENAVPIPVIISNLSISGALIDSGADLGDIGDFVALAFTLRIQPNEYEADLKVDAMIHTINKRHSADFAGREFFEYGMEFPMLPMPEAIMLQNFIYQVLVEDHHKIV